MIETILSVRRCQMTVPKKAIYLPDGTVKVIWPNGLMDIVSLKEFQTKFGGLPVCVKDEKDQKSA